MERRKFIKKTLYTAGALSVASAGSFAAATGTMGGKTGASALADASAKDKSPLLKSIMWGSVGLQGSVLEKRKAIKEAGFDGIEPNSHLDRQEVPDAMQATGLKALSVCNSKRWENLMSLTDASVRRKGIENMMVAMEDARTYGMDVVLLVPGRVDENTPYEACRTRSTELYKGTDAVSRKNGDHLLKGGIFKPVDKFPYPVAERCFCVGRSIAHSYHNDTPARRYVNNLSVHA
jgi:hexulose-6-phosphate isomerase